MTDKTFRVQFFQVKIPNGAPPGQVAFDKAILDVSGFQLDQRERYIDPKHRRLEDVKQSGDIFLMNFTTFNYPGPGRVKSGMQSAPFSMAADDYFATETAMLYDPEMCLLLIETGLRGMGPGATAKYFAGFAGQGAAYDPIPMLDKEAAARARKCKVFRKIDMRFAVGQATDVDRAGGHGAIAAFGENFGAKVMDVSMNLGPGRSGTLSLEPIGSLINSVVGSDDGDITRLRVSAKENEDDPIEVIDLLQHREKRERTLAVDPASRKVPINVRWKAMQEILADFCANVT